MLQNLFKEYCLVKMQSQQKMFARWRGAFFLLASFFHSAVSCKPGHFLGLWNVLLDAKGESGSENFQDDQLPSVFPLLLKWAAYQKFKVFRRFSNQLRSVSMNWVGEWDISEEVNCRGISGKFYSGARPVLKTGVRPTNQTLQPKNQTN